MHTDRRAFMTTLAASIAAPAILRARQKKRWPIAFSTLGCPAWSWKTILEQSDKLGFAAIELRGVAGEMDLPKVPELSGSRLSDTKKDLAALGLVVSDLGASASMHETGAAREKAMDEGKRFIDLAHAMGVKYVRMFGNSIPPGEPRDAVFARVIDGFRQMSAHAKQRASPSCSNTRRLHELETTSKRCVPVSGPMRSPSCGTHTTRSWPATKHLGAAPGLKPNR